MPEILTVEQGSREWLEARMGMPTASQFSTVMAKGRGGGESKIRAKYLRQLAGEIITGEPMENYSNSHMERGKTMEAEARSAYEFITGNEAVEVGFIREGRAGASPDSLIGDDGLLEIKTKLPHLMIECYERGAIPAEHVAQVQGQIWVSGREWCDFVAYWPGMPLFTVRVERDPEYIGKIAAGVAAFNRELDEIVEFVRSIK